jgi:hypothetical protein
MAKITKKAVIKNKEIRQWINGKEVEPNLVAIEHLHSKIGRKEPNIINRKRLVGGIFVDEKIEVAPDVTEIKSGNETIKFWSPEKQMEQAKWSVLIRDNWTCQWPKCGKTIFDTRIEVNHEYPVSKYPECALDEDKMKTYCTKHHAQWHRERGENSEARLIESRAHNHKKIKKIDAKKLKQQFWLCRQMYLGNDAALTKYFTKNVTSESSGLR